MRWHRSTAHLPDQRGLIIYYDLKAKVVNQMLLVENWPGPKAAREYRAVEEFALPNDPRP